MLVEHNVVTKDPRKVEIKFASCYPNLYKTAMSSLGFHIIYDLLNSWEDVYCERVIYPYPKSFESSTPLKDFDLAGFSLQYEQDYFNLLEMLEMGKVPVRKDQRTRIDPLVIAGGPCASSNPLPLSRFVDLFIVGEGEVILDRVLDTYLEVDDPRREIDAFLDIKGVYVPDNPVKMAVVKDMRKAHHPIRQVIPETGDKRFIPAFGRAILLGVSRGCARGCRFCMAGCIYRPRRETPLRLLFDVAERARHATHLSRVALIGSAVSDYSQMDDLCEGLLERGFTITTPSLRIDSLTEHLLDTLKESGLKTITIAPESTWRLRKVVNKPISDERIIETIKMVFKLKMNVKLYFLVGLPTETVEDVQDMVEFIRKLNKWATRKNSLRISINPFIPKAHTPFQWEDFDFDTTQSKIGYLQSKLKSIPLKLEKPKYSLKQYILSTGDAELGILIEKAWKQMVPLREWKIMAPRRELDDDLPWENIDVGIKPDFLKREYLKALNGELTPWCETFGCHECGACEKT